jgi:hypothetical protein
MPSSKRNRQEDDASAEKDKTNDAAPAKKKAVKSAAAEDVASADDLETSGTNPTPIFLKKTYKMIDSCDPSIATWSEDGLSFVVKDPDTFSAEIIPQYFDHNKLSSFARQLNCESVHVDTWLCFMSIPIFAFKIADCSPIFCVRACTSSVYGFRKIQTKPIKNADYDETTAKYGENIWICSLYLQFLKPLLNSDTCCFHLQLPSLMRSSVGDGKICFVK